jgi:hypothetical protein
MALKMILEGTPASFPVQVFNPSAPIYWEAGNVATLDSFGKVTVLSAASEADIGGSGMVLGILADRRSTTVGISNANYLPSLPAGTTGYGDEALFNQPGMGNSLYGTTNGVNNVIPANSIPTTTLLRDETAQNVNTDSRYVTVYIRGGLYATDQFDASAATAMPGTPLFANANGVLSTTGVGATASLAMVTKPVDGNGLLEFKLTLV